MIWKDVGIYKIQYLFQEETLSFFLQLRTEFDLPQNQLFRYLQLWSYVQSVPIYKKGLCIIQLENILLKDSSLRNKLIR